MALFTPQLTKKVGLNLMKSILFFVTVLIIGKIEEANTCSRTIAESYENGKLRSIPVDDPIFKSPERILNIRRNNNTILYEIRKVYVTDSYIEFCNQYCRMSRDYKNNISNDDVIKNICNFKITRINLKWS